MPNQRPTPPPGPLPQDPPDRTPPGRPEAAGARPGRFRATLETLIPPGRKYANLDGLRCLAILMVFNVHFFAQFAAERFFTGGHPVLYPLMKTVQSGLFGVDIFFVLSGLLTTLSLARRPGAPLAFLAGRYARLLPVVLVVNLPALCWGTGAPDIRQVLDNLLFLSLFPGTSLVTYVTWVLVYEMYFYLLCAAALAVPFKYGTRCAAWSLAAAAVLGLANAWAGWFPRLNLFGDPRFWGFYYGAALGLAVLLGRKAPLAAVGRLWPWALAGIGLCCFLWGNDAVNARLTGSWPLGALFYTFLDLCIAALTAGLLDPDSPARAVFASRPARLLGVASYSFFMVHAQWGLPLGNTLFGGPPASLASLLGLYLLSLAVSAALALFLYAHLERPYFARPVREVRP